MSWLTPIGFLGLIGLIVLLIIYLIKPNYQTKQISSTYVWKLSLKYRKKKLPISKLRNILLVICQCLIITACAFILAQPFIDGEDANSAREKVIIIDASGSMRAEIDNETRFERAVEMAKEYAKEALDHGGKVSVILADRNPYFVVQRLGSEDSDKVMTELSFLTDSSDFKCSYEAGDIDASIQLAELILAENPKAEVVLYTGTEYVDSGKVVVKDVTDPGEWNVAVLDVRAVMDQNYYRFEVDAGSYSRGHNLRLYLEIHGAEAQDLGENGTQKGDVVSLYCDVILDQNESKTITFGQNELDDYTGLKIYSYDYVFCYVQEADSMSIDNSFYLYGGKSQPLKVQYYSTLLNNFVSGVLVGMREQLKQDWDIQIDEIRDSEMAVQAGEGKDPALTGYDIYIFEHHMPKTLPTDGLVILINPSKLPGDADIQLGLEYTASGEAPLNSGEEPATEILNHVDASKITLTKYRQIVAYDGSYTPFLFVNDEPVALVRNENNCKVMVFTFSLHYSNFALTPAFPTIMGNAIEMFLPTTFEKDVYNVYDEVELNSRSPQLSVNGPTIAEMFEEFPASIEVNDPGLYTVVQTPISGVQVVENFFVTIPDEQSNIDAMEDRLTNPYYPPADADPDVDMVFYFALALVLLGFAEWWLKGREHI